VCYVGVTICEGEGAILGENHVFFYSEPYSDMHFAATDRFPLHLLYTMKLDKIQFPIIKGIILTNYFEITRKLK